eukprot:TRINITY_DN8535_c0_g1_i1.p1 TRINITY_DN8535_c0_g1~~TRINITY_DN8535_c0_g1_i1.p1  ORF type:complete len:125 (+),score=47.26 TRINITY_DN8535_c0_g1_i1:476-850(+)
MVQDLDFAVEVVGAELVREPDGLAMSSRNVLLSPDARQRALSISRSLQGAKAAVARGVDDYDALKRQVAEAVEGAGGLVDYVEVVHRETLKPMEGGRMSVPAVMAVAAKFGGVRLIDNVELDSV